MRLIQTFLFLNSLFPIVSLLRILVYSPVFGYSHSNFLGKIADTLTERGHNVTFFAPIIDESKKEECRGVKLTKDVVYVDRNDEMRQMSEHTVMSQEMIESFWLVKMDSSNIAETEEYYGKVVEVACRNLFSRNDIFEAMKSRNFDLAIVEPLTVCGLGFAAALGITKTILVATCSFYDNILPYIGEPFDYSSTPGSFGASGEVMSMWEKWENWKMASVMSRLTEDSFEKQMTIYREFRGAHLPHWRDLFATASAHFINSNAYLDFPRPVLQKTVLIGGLSVNFEWIKAQKLPEEWEKVLAERPHTMLISFGSMLKSAFMPAKWRSGILRAIQHNPNVTFIWKYESNDTSFATDTPNIHFSQWVPQPSLLNDPRLSAFLTHGGLGSTFELAHCGKPSVMVPLFYDQFRNANMMVRHEVATSLATEQLGDWRIVDGALKAVLFDEKYTKRARRLAEMLRNQPSPPKETVIKYTEFVGKYGPFPQMDPYGRQLTFFQREFFDVYAVFVGVLVVIILAVILIVRVIRAYAVSWGNREKTGKTE